MSSNVLVLGLGNDLMGDDGVGHALIDALHARVPTSAHVRLEKGADVFSLLELWHGEQEVWLVDAVYSGAKNGSMHRLNHEKILELNGNQHSVHGLALAECLRWMLLATPEMRTIRFRLWGIEAHSICPGEKLNGLIRGSMSDLVDELIQTLGCV